jgi:acetyl-CoA carboxylase carboxyltransferase component
MTTTPLRSVPTTSPADPSLREVSHADRRLRAGVTTIDELSARRQHARGKLPVRERLELLLDKDSFVEINLHARHRADGFGIEHHRPATDGVITGWGTVDGRPVAVFAHDASIYGGAMGEASAGKIHRLMDLAESAGVPIIGLNDGAGARIQEGIRALAGVGGIFLRNVRASGVVPQISLVLGACAGGAAYSPALTDFVLMVEGTSKMFVTGPDVLAAATGQTISQDELGGAAVHARTTGLATFVEPDERACLATTRKLLSYLPSNNQQQAPDVEATDPPHRRCEALYDLVPTNPRRGYDVRAVLEAIVDDGDYLELHQRWAPNIVCAFGRLAGRSVGFVANQPSVRAGALDIDASEKAARFVRTCDEFNIPLVTLVDVPGFIPGADQERGGILRRGAKLLYAYCEATVPRIQVILRKAYGGAYITMDSKSIGADLSFAWPGNEIAVMGAESAASIVFRREIERADDPEARREELLAEYRDRLLSPYVAAQQGLVDDVIDPADTRTVLIRSLELLRNKRVERPNRKHGNVPL